LEKLKKDQQVFAFGNSLTEPGLFDIEISKKLRVDPASRPVLVGKGPNRSCLTVAAVGFAWAMSSLNVFPIGPIHPSGFLKPQAVA
jgi:hypothetical protein